MRLIDADAFEKFIAEKYKDGESTDDIKDQMLFDLSFQPTAYDAEKVAEELKKENAILKAAIRKASDDFEEIQRQLEMNTIISQKHFVFPLQHIQDELVGAIEDGDKL